MKWKLKQVFEIVFVLSGVNVVDIERMLIVLETQFKAAKYDFKYDNDIRSALLWRSQDATLSSSSSTEHSFVVDSTPLDITLHTSADASSLALSSHSIDDSMRRIAIAREFVAWRAADDDNIVVGTLSPIDALLPTSLAHNQTLYRRLFGVSFHGW
jgi:hypothetical protein